ncbi:hypothetical protein FUAX_05170 [Fulvitalea axinellae]|uniref:DUF4304 domain-containing protein n=1 Tax=Fulvitalea axinellae TaxID=1182444 RepID=A0AAU9D7C5_9BACT|nr:hypothetical protein FUAX_05170 [Fulvitalea axinellae]
MKEFNLYKDIKNSINQNAFRIKKYGFKKFKEGQLAYEYHFTSTNGKGDEIDISFEAISSSPIWVRINNTHLERILEDKKLEEIRSAKNALYNGNFNKYLELEDAKYLGDNFENYKARGKELNDQELNRIFEILGDKLEELLVKSDQRCLSIKEPPPLSDTVFSLREVSKTAEFRNDFERYKYLIIETDKCQIEIFSIEELNSALEWLSDKNITNIEWEFVE